MTNAAIYSDTRVHSFLPRYTRQEESDLRLSLAELKTGIKPMKGIALPKQDTPVLIPYTDPPFIYCSRDGLPFLVRAFKPSKEFALVNLDAELDPSKVVSFYYHPDQRVYLFDKGSQRFIGSVEMVRPSGEPVTRGTALAMDETLRLTPANPEPVDENLETKIFDAIDDYVDYIKS